MNSQEQIFIKGFNAGYQLCKYEPALIEHLLADCGVKGEYIKAVELGKRAYEREKVIAKLHSEKGLSKEKGIDLE